MNDYQLSSLTNENVCKKCASCCKSLAIWVQDSEGMSDRLSFLQSPVISYIRTGIVKHSIEWLILVINLRCIHLNENNGIYSCKIWDSSEKPNLCRSYPSNQFYDFVSNTPATDEGYINKAISAAANVCPALKGQTIFTIKQDQELQLKKNKEEKNEWYQRIK